MTKKSITRTHWDFLPIAIRAHVRTMEMSAPPTKMGRKPPGPSRWSLIFDFETTIDETQRPRIGAYQVRKDGEQLEKGLIYDPEAVSRDELKTLRDYEATHGLALMTLTEFIEDVFFRVGFDYRATIIGFNLPFDLSRMALEHSAARPHERRKALELPASDAVPKEPTRGRGRTMAGGFSLKLSPHPWHPRVQVKYLSRRAALIRFAAPASQRATRWQRIRGEWAPIRRGFFADVKTLAAAFLSEGFKLADLAEVLKVPHQKLSAKHGGPITPDYIQYNLQDVQTTWECFATLAERYAGYRLTRTHLHSILSEASLGKAHLKEMNIRPFREMQPDFPPELFGRIMSTYFGGRSEVHLRRVYAQVLYCDFVSMYPTVCTLMGLWRFVIAKGVTWKDTTDTTRRFLEQIRREQLRDRGMWPQLCVLVEVVPDDDIFPVRSEYGRAQYTIGANYLTNDKGQWFTLADCISAKLLSGKTPQVLRAITFEPGPVQDGLKSILVAGNSAYPVDPAKADFYKLLIDLRKEVQAKAEAATDEAEKSRLDTLQQSLKILANATSYGIFVELIVSDLGKRQAITCFGAEDEGFEKALNKIEDPGTYFHPLLATLITSAARLMLAAAESLTKDAGLDWAFCDTDSTAMAKPSAMDNATFYAKALSVSEWFTPLNPYASGGPLLKVEKLNYKLGDKSGALHPLFCYAVSAKRYVLFNIDENGKPVLRKVSRHGLGHLLPPYGDNDAPPEFPAPVVSLKELKVRRWQHDIWYRIVEAALAGQDDAFNAAAHPAFRKPVASQYAATTPRMLDWFKSYNLLRKYVDQVHPFNFLLSFQARKPKDGSPPPRIVAPYRDNPSDAVPLCIDRNTGEKIKSPHLVTYEEALAQYHMHAEAKFLNGGETERGLTLRRHVRVSSVRYIGKEANRWVEQFFLGHEPDAQLEYGMAPRGKADLLRNALAAAKAYGKRALARAARVSMRHLADILSGKAPVTAASAAMLANAMPKLDADRQERAARERGHVEQLRSACIQSGGVRKLAIELDIDPTNLSKAVSGKRKMTGRLLAKLELRFSVEEPDAAD